MLHPYGLRLDVRTGNLRVPADLKALSTAAACIVRTILNGQNISQDETYKC